MIADKHVDLYVESVGRGDFGREIRSVIAIASAANEYVAARKANEAASVDSWSIAAARVDAAWHELLRATGYADSGEET